MLTEAKGFGAPSLSVALRGGCAFTGPWGGAAGPLGLGSDQETHILLHHERLSLHIALLGVHV